MSNVLLYVDGNLQQTTTTTPTVLINTATNFNPVQIANSALGLSASTLYGCVDDVRIYDEVLSAAQIAQLVYGPGNPPGVTAQPGSATATLGSTNATAQFSVGVSGSPTLLYQWKKGGVNIPGATNQILTINPVTAANLGSYSVAITNNYGFAISASATLSWATPATDPVEQTVLVGSNATFSITMPVDSTGYTYQWQKAGAPISNETNSTFTIPSAVLGDAANYAVAVTVGGQSATSAPAALHVLSVPASGYAALVLGDYPAAYWRLGEINGSSVAIDQTGFHNGSYLGYTGSELEAAGAITGDANTASSHTGANYVEVPYSAALQHNTQFTLEAWVNPSALSGTRVLICSRNQFFSSGYELALNNSQARFRTGTSTSPGFETWNDLSGGSLTAGEWHHIVGTYDGTTKRLYVDGALVGSQPIGVLATPVLLRLGAGLTYNPVPGQYLNGTLDEAAVYWKALSDSQVAAHYSAGAFGFNMPPFIIQDPVGGSRYEYGRIALSASAGGTPSLSYQWKHAGTNLPGQTSASLVLAGLSTADAGLYSVAVTNAFGSTNSADATLAIVPLTAQGYNRVIMKDGPTAYYPLDDTNGSPAAMELNNFGAYDGTYYFSPTLEQSGATPATGKSVAFDGFANFMGFGNPAGLNFSGQISLEAWINPATNYASGFGDIIAHGFGGSPSMEVFLRINAGQYQAGSFDGATHQVSAAMPAADTNQWVQLVGTYDGVAWNLYRNGLLIARSTNSTGAVQVNDNWAVGARGLGDQRFFQGGVDEVVIYDYALTPAQVGNHYLQATGDSAVLSIVASGGSVTVTWNAGMLEEATNINGPWTSLPTATSPRTVPATGTGKYFRVRR
jgi:hypothetical protein